MRPTDSRKGLYRSRNRMIGGVCAGIAEYFDLSTFWIRFGAVLLFLFTGFWPIVFIYFAAALIMKPEPVASPPTSNQKKTFDAGGRTKRRYENLEQRIRNMEDIVTSKEYDFDRRLYNG